LDLFGGTDGIRDEGALQSAVAQSLQVYFTKMAFLNQGREGFKII